MKRKVVMDFKKTVLGLSLALCSVSVYAVSITSPVIGGSGDVKLYSSNGTIVTEIGTPTFPADLVTVLGGNAAAPGGNVELFASSDGLSNAAFASASETTLSGSLGGNAITLSSLTAADWATPVGNGSMTLGEKWFDDVLSANLTAAEYSGLALPILTYYGAFVAAGGQQQFSDANISYVEETGGVVDVGLAGFIDAKLLLDTLLGTNLTGPTIAFSEIVQIDYDGISGYLYGVGPGSVTSSGQVSSDPTASFTGNFGLTTGVGGNLVQATVPLPGTLALFGAGAAVLLGFRRRQAKL